MKSFALWIRSVFTNTVCLDVSFESRTSEAQLIDWVDIEELAWDDLNIVYPFQSRLNAYLKCTQFGNFLTNVNSKSLFGTSISQELYSNGCSTIFQEL